MTEYLILFLIVLGIHLTPAFTPPTWPVIALYTVSMTMPVPLLVVSAAIAAALGRYALAHGTRLVRRRLGDKARNNLDAAYTALARTKRRKGLVLGLFAVSPFSSALLFEAAGIAGARLIAPTVAYFAGRIAFYSVYAVTARSIAELSLGDAFRDKITSPIGIAVQIGILAVLLALIFVDWSGAHPRQALPETASLGHNPRMRATGGVELGGTEGGRKLDYHCQRHPNKDLTDSNISSTFL